MSQAPRKHIVRLAEGVELRYELASPLARMVALAVDAAVLGAFLGLVTPLLQPFFELGSWGMPVYILAYFAFDTLYSLFMEWLDGGRTLGKRALRLRVLDREGRPLVFYQALLRNLLRNVDRLPFFYGLGALVAFLNPRWQRLGDLAAGTMVVRERRASQADWSLVAPERFNSLRAHRRIAARLRQWCSAEEAELGSELLHRSAELDDGAKLELFKGLAQRFRHKLGADQSLLEGLSDEQAVRGVVDLLYEARQEEAD